MPNVQVPMVQTKCNKSVILYIRVKASYTKQQQKYNLTHHMNPLIFFFYAKDKKHRASNKKHFGSQKRIYIYRQFFLFALVLILLYTAHTRVQKVYFALAVLYKFLLAPCKTHPPILSLSLSLSTFFTREDISSVCIIVRMRESSLSIHKRSYTYI